jgi:hypothetical protein
VASTQSTPTGISLAQDGSSLRFDDLRPGDVLLYRPKAPAVHQRMISKQSASPYTHAAIYLGDGFVAEALVSGGVQKNPLGSVLKGAAYVGVLRSQAGFGADRASQLTEFIDQIIAHGRGYDRKGALAWKYTNRDFLASQMEIIARHYGEFQPADEIAKSAFFCSALVVACFAAVGIIDNSAQVAYPPAAFAPGGLCTDPTFGWALGYLVPEGNSVPEDDPLRFVTQWADVMEGQ